MKFIFSFLLITSLNFFNSSVSADPSEISSSGSRATKIVPNKYSDTSGTATFNGPLANAQRTYQLLIQASQLTDLVGSNLTGLSWRLRYNIASAFPSVDITYTSYDIYLSESVEPSARSLTFANNIVGSQTQVRSGPLTILAGSYPIGGSSTNPNSFGTEISFNTPWLYSGGNLLVEIRHSGFTGTSSSVDAIGTAISGYGTQFSACWTGSYTGVSGTQGNFSVLKLSTSPLTLQLTSLIEGLYDGNANTMVSDTAKVYLRKDFSPYDIVDSAVSVLDITGNGTFTFSNAFNGVNYFIVVSQRNSIDTWSATGVSFTGNSLSYDFTPLSSSAYGNNLIQIGSRWTIYSGDVNKDGFVDLTDLIQTANDASSFASGYLVTDVNGDLFVTLADIVIVFNNSSAFVTEARPF